MSGPVLSVEDLSVQFRSRQQTVNAVNGVTFDVAAGETLVLLGESGSGKSVTALAIMGLLDSPPAHVTGGRICFDGRDVLRMPKDERRHLRGRRMAMIFQDALSALNPVLSVGWQIAEMLRVHEGLSRQAARARAIELMDRVHIPAAAARFDDYPHQFSGGMRQRTMIAMALSLQPELLIADEPTTALDVTVQAQIMRLLSELQQEFAMGLLLITHDLGVAADVADRMAVMYAGRIVETASALDLYRAPGHPYTRGLLGSVPSSLAKGMSLTPISGAPPNLARIPGGCAFHPRCPMAQSICSEQLPELRVVGADRSSACHFAEEVLAR